MQKQDIAKILSGLCSLMLLATPLAGEQNQIVNPAEIPVEYKKNNSVIDINLLRKRVNEAPKQLSTWIDNTNDFQFIYPSSLTTSHQFDANYLQTGNWSYFVQKKEGHPLVALTLPSTAKKTTIAEIRIGVSNEHQVIRQCLHLPSNATPNSLKTVKINNISYTTFTGNDAAMNKYIQVQAYRTIHKNQCFSIELMVYGTHPDVIDPPDYAALKPKEAMKRLTRLWRQMDFKWLPQK